jgi:hypothetical protein
MVIATTLMTPPALKWSFGRAARKAVALRAHADAAADSKSDV